MSANTKVREMDMDDIRNLNRRNGQHWFEAGTMRFFRSRVGEYAYRTVDGKLAYFVSSERGPDGVRRYSVREADLTTGDIRTAGTFQEWPTRSRADTWAKHLARHN